MMLSSKMKKFSISSSEIAFGLNPWTWKGQQERTLVPWISTVVSYQCNTYFVYYHRVPINHLEHPHLESINILPIRSRPRLLFTISPKWRACSQANSRLSLHPFKLLWMHCLDLSFSFFLKVLWWIDQRKPGYFIAIFFLIPPFGSFSQPLIRTFNIKIATLQYTWNLK